MPVNVNGTVIVADGAIGGRTSEPLNMRTIELSEFNPPTFV